jgi:hypothetical protein
MSQKDPLFLVDSRANNIKRGFKNHYKLINITIKYLASTTYSSPAIPSTTRLSLVSVPVLSKQHISTLPANGIRNGSVQNTPGRYNFHIKNPKPYKITTCEKNAKYS